MNEFGFKVFQNLSEIGHFIFGGILDEFGHHVFGVSAVTVNAFWLKRRRR